VSVNLALAVDEIVGDSFANNLRVLDHVLFSEKLLWEVERDHSQNALQQNVNNTDHYASLFLDMLKDT
jgi:hypothetical protein